MFLLVRACYSLFTSKKKGMEGRWGEKKKKGGGKKEISITLSTEWA